MQTKSTMNGMVTSPESEVEEIKITIVEAKEKVAQRDALLKLSRNKAFKDMILQGYLKDEAVRLAAISGRVEMREYREEIMDALKGISHFQQWMDGILNQGDMAEGSILEHERALNDLYEEGDEVLGGTDQ